MNRLIVCQLIAVLAIITLIATEPKNQSETRPSQVVPQLRF